MTGQNGPDGSPGRFAAGMTRIAILRGGGE
jgi:hypothetical protein